MKKYIAILFACVSFCACEDFLTQENPNKIESEYYFKDESSLEIYANGLPLCFPSQKNYSPSAALPSFRFIYRRTRHAPRTGSSVVLRFGRI